MGQNSSIASLVFTPPDPPTYNQLLKGFFWIPVEKDPGKNRNIPAVFYKYKDRETGKGYFK